MQQLKVSERQWEPQVWGTEGREVDTEAKSEEETRPQAPWARQTAVRDGWRRQPVRGCPSRAVFLNGGGAEDSPKRHWASSGDTVSCDKGAVRAPSGSVNIPQRPGQPHTAKGYWAPNVNGAGIHTEPDAEVPDGWSPVGASQWLPLGWEAAGHRPVGRPALGASPCMDHPQAGFRIQNSWPAPQRLCQRGWG